MNIFASTLIALALIVGGFLLGRATVAPPPPVGVLHTRLAVPAACREALDHGDEVVLLLGEAVGAAARGQDPSYLLQRAVPSVDRYKRTASRCRALEGSRP